MDRLFDWIFSLYGYRKYDSQTKPEFTQYLYNIHFAWCFVVLLVAFQKLKKK